jgi:WD40 repeat protein
LLVFAQLLAKMTDDRLALLGNAIPIRDVCDLVISYVPLFQGKQIQQLGWCTETAVGEIYRLSDTRVIIQSLDGVLSIWDLVTNSCMQTFAPRGGVKHVAAIHENLLASVGPLGVMVWGIDGFLRAKLCMFAFRLCSVQTGLAVLEGPSGRLSIWDWAHRPFAVKEMIQPEAAGTDLVSINDGHHVAVSFKDHTVRAFDVHTGEHLLIFTGHLYIKKLQSVSTGLLFEHDQMLRSWNVKTQNLVVIPIDAVASYYSSAVVRASSDYLVTIIPNSIGHVWNLADETLIAQFVVDILFRQLGYIPFANVRACVAVGEFVAVQVGSHAVRIYA